MLRYRLTLEPDDNGTILVTSPDLPIATFGGDPADACRQAVDATVTLIESMMDAGEDVPAPEFENRNGTTFITLPLQTELRVRLHLAMRGAGLTRAKLARRFGWRRT